MPWSHRGGEEVQVHYLTPAPDGGGWSTPRPGLFTPGERPAAHCIRKLGGPQDRSTRARKISPPLRSDPRTVQSIACRNTDWAIPAHTADRASLEGTTYSTSTNATLENTTTQLRHEIRQTTLDRFLKEKKILRKVIPMNRGSIPGKCTSCYLLQRVQTGPETYPDPYSAGTRTAFPVVKRPAYGTDHCPSTAKVLNEWNYNSTSSYSFITCTLTTSP
jgi:hypothetical protein